MATATTHEFEVGGHRLVYDEYGSGPRTLVLVHGLLLSRKMHGPLASALADRGHRVLCLDLLGHGSSDRPRDMWRYSMPIFGEQVIALLDHVGVDEAVMGGTSLGANVSLEVATRDPSRLRGMVVEMPVLDNALLACALAFTPLLVGLTFGAPAARVVALAAGAVPRGVSQLGDIVLDAVSQDPRPSAAVLQGLFFGRVAPPREERREIETPALVIGHGRDPIHPFSDSDMLVRELRNGRIVQAESILELRLAPERLTSEIADFVDACWRPATARSRRGRSRPERRSA
ncbi:MAG TPA: alpha/beta fold hydrolase [Thermoleophilaceae bacterium]|nr:alpha/beta fold hydrolase [Thermoleophilaceae bacterium]